MSQPEPHYPGAVPPERQHDLEYRGLRLHLSEWGDPAAPPVLLCHGLFDHGRGFDTLAPRLAQRFRVVALDARGHGESSWADAYSWVTELGDIAAAIEFVGAPAHLVGHSRGGGQVTDLATMVPDLVRCVVNLDGFGPPAEGASLPGGVPLDLEAPRRLQLFLDRRRRSGSRDGWRPYAGLEDLVERRRAQNPRLSSEWLRYFAYHGARRSEDGWRWKADPWVAQGVGPWRPQWIGPLWKTLRAPLLAVVGTEVDTWGPLPEPLLAERLEHVTDLHRATVSGAGHFVHMEQPDETADLLLGFLPR